MDESQEARTQLRERYLRFLAGFDGSKEVEVEMSQKTSIKCKIRAFDLRNQNMLVVDMKTPSADFPKAVIRLSDVKYCVLPNK